MADKLRSTGASGGPMPPAGQPAQWQIGAVAAIAGVIAAVVTGLLGLEVVPHIIGAFVITLVLGLAGIALVRRINRRHG
jgi:hypothetical protein